MALVLRESFDKRVNKGWNGGNKQRIEPSPGRSFPIGELAAMKGSHLFEEVIKCFVVRKHQKPHLLCCKPLWIKTRSKFLNPIHFFIRHNRFCSFSYILAMITATNHGNRALTP